MLPGLRLLLAPVVGAVVARQARRTMDAGETLVLNALVRPTGPGAPAHRGDPGRLTLTPTDLHWQPESGPPWSVPIPRVRVARVSGGASLGRPCVDIEIAGAGPWRVIASDLPLEGVRAFGAVGAYHAAEVRTAHRVAHLLRTRAAAPPLGPPT